MVDRRSLAPDTAPCRVLVVEDNADGREALRLLLGMLGHPVEVAENGLAGVRQALLSRPDAVILDLDMPGLDGQEAARRIRAALGPQATLLAYTAYDLDDLGLRLEDTPFDAWLSKPGDLDLLVDCLYRRALAHSSVGCHVLRRVPGALRGFMPPPRQDGPAGLAALRGPPA
jgi:CheY-like chemotaxis protein